jgi:hypothetical protein
LYYYNARWYDAKLGRFIQPDKIIPDNVLPTNFDRYAYCMNQPTNKIDPSGHNGILALFMVAVPIIAVAAMVYVVITPPERREQAVEDLKALGTDVVDAVFKGPEKIDEALATQPLYALWMLGTQYFSDEAGKRLGGNASSDTGGQTSSPYGPFNRKPGDDHPEINIKDKSFGKKAGQHMGDFGLDPSSAADRATFSNMIQDIRYNYESTRIGSWRTYQNCQFYMKDGIVVITDEFGNFITILDEGLKNSWWLGAKPVP